MERYQQLFSQLATRKEGAFVPFVTIGDPQPTLSLQIIETFIDAGADALELGMPFSDPLADGPIIQNSTLRAFAAGMTPEHCFEILAAIRRKHPDIPIGLLMYANLVFNNGIDAFYAHCAEVGVDSVLVADVPLQESQPFHHAAIHHGVAPIFICPPNADEDLIRKIAYHGRAYTYLLSRAGVTGNDKSGQYGHTPLEHLVNALKKYHAAPALLGFGIAEPSQVRSALKVGAAGAISGSALVRLIEKYEDQPTVLLEKLAQFVRNMKAATHNLRA